MTSVANELRQSMLGIPLPWFVKTLATSLVLVTISNVLSLFTPVQFDCRFNATDLSNYEGLRFWMNTQCNADTSNPEGKLLVAFYSVNISFLFVLAVTLGIIFMVSLSSHFSKCRNIKNNMLLSRGSSAELKYFKQQYDNFKTDTGCSLGLSLVVSFSSLFGLASFILSCILAVTLHDGVDCSQTIDGISVVAKCAVSRYPIIFNGIELLFAALLVFFSSLNLMSWTHIMGSSEKLVSLEQTICAYSDSVFSKNDIENMVHLAECHEDISPDLLTKWQTTKFDWTNLSDEFVAIETFVGAVLEQFKENNSNRLAILKMIRLPAPRHHLVNEVIQATRHVQKVLDMALAQLKDFIDDHEHKSKVFNAQFEKAISTMRRTLEQYSERVATKSIQPDNAFQLSLDGQKYMLALAQVKHSLAADYTNRLLSKSSREFLEKALDLIKNAPGQDSLHFNTASVDVLLRKWVLHRTVNMRWIRFLADGYN